MNNMIRAAVLALVALVGLGGASGARAQDATHEILRELQKHNAVLTPLAPMVDGTRPWLVELEGEVHVFYETPGGVIIVGVAYGPDKRTLTRDHLAQSPLYQQSVAAATPVTGDVWADLERTAWIRIGREEAPPLYVFVDPLCPFCHKLWQDAYARHVLAGEVQLRLIVVGIRGAESERMADAVLGAPDPGQAWGEVMETRSLARSPTALGMERRMVNRAVMERYRINAVPFLLYRSGGAVQVVHGVPQDLDAVIASMDR